MFVYLYFVILRNHSLVTMKFYVHESKWFQWIWKVWHFCSQIFKFHIKNYSKPSKASFCNNPVFASLSLLKPINKQKPHKAFIQNESSITLNPIWWCYREKRYQYRCFVFISGWRIRKEYILVKPINEPKIRQILTWVCITMLIYLFCFHFHWLITISNQF